MTAGGGGILVLTHGANEGPELLQQAAEARELVLQMVRVDEVADRLPDPREFDAVMVLGSNESVYDDAVSWIPPEVALVRLAVASDVPVLGVCFGGQLLSYALGGTVGKAPVTEVGWLWLQSDDTDLVPPGPWLAWHSDAFSVPPGAQRLAWSDLCPHAFASGPHLGLQFHPEVSPRLLRTWLDEADRAGNGEAHHRESLLAQAELHAAGSARRAGVLLDHFLQRSARGAQALREPG